jgi:hypothetical protein
LYHVTTVTTRSPRVNWLAGSSLRPLPLAERSTNTALSVATAGPRCKMPSCARTLAVERLARPIARASGATETNRFAISTKFPFEAGMAALNMTQIRQKYG